MLLYSTRELGNERREVTVVVVVKGSHCCCRCCCFKQQKLILLQFWSPEVQSQDVGRDGSSWKFEGESVAYLPPGFGGCQESLVSLACRLIILVSVSPSSNTKSDQDVLESSNSKVQ